MGKRKETMAAPQAAATKNGKAARILAKWNAEEKPLGKAHAKKSPQPAPKKAPAKKPAAPKAPRAPTQIELEDAEAARLMEEYNARQADPAQRSDTLTSELAFKSVPIGTIAPSPLNPRKFFDPESLKELADSIVDKGILQPLLVRYWPLYQVNGLSDDKVATLQRGELVEIIFGERRWRAAMLAVADGRLPADYQVPVRIKIVCDDRELVLLAAAENFQRSDMTPIEEADTFEFVRPYAVRQDGDDIDTAIGRLLNKSRRTVFRRRKLLQLAPELRRALDVGDINLGQAEAFATGDVENQVRLLTELRDGDLLADPDEANPDTIQWEMTIGRIATGAAIFDHALYTGEIITDEPSGRTYFGDKAAFVALQEAAIEAERARLAKLWPWVEVERTAKFRMLYAEAQDGDENQGAVIVVNPQSFDVEVLTSLITAAGAAKRQTVAAAASAGLIGPAGKQKEARGLTDAQAIAVKHAKTQALRLCVAGDENVALALTILGLLGCSEVAIGDTRHFHGPSNRAAPLPSVERRLANLLAPISKALAADGAQADWRGLDILGPSRQALIFRAVMALGREQQLELLAFLTAERIGSWFDPYKTRIHDSPLAIAVAEVTVASAELAEIWQPDEAYFAAMPTERLRGRVRQHNLISELTAANCEWSQLGKARKSQLVAACLDAPEGFWTPDKFPELQFLDEAAMKAALTGAPADAEDVAA